MAQQSLISLVIRATAQTPGVNQALGSVAGGVVNLAGKTQKLNQQFQKTGFFLTAMLQRAGQFAKRGGQVLVGAFGNMLKVAGDFDKQITRIGAKLRLGAGAARSTTKEMEVLRDVFLDVASDLPASAGELASLGEAFTQLGLIKVSDNLETFRSRVEALTKTTVALSNAAGGLPIGQAATKLGALVNIFSIANQTGQEFDRNLDAIAGQLSTAATISGGTADEIFRVVQRFGQMGEAAGLTRAQIFGLAAITQDVKLRAATAGTNINRFIQSLAEGVTRSASFARSLGITSTELENIKNGSENTFLVVIKALSRLKDIGSGKSLAAVAGFTEVLKNMGINSQRATVVVQALAQGVGKLTTTTQRLTEVNANAQRGISELQDAFEQSIQNIGDAQKAYESAVEAFKIKLIAPGGLLIIKVFTALKDAINFIGDAIPGPILFLISSFILVSGAILLAVGALLLLASFIGTIRLLTKALADEAGVAFGFNDFIKLPFLAVANFFSDLKRKLFEVRMQVRLTEHELEKLGVHPNFSEGLARRPIPVSPVRVSGGTRFQPLPRLPGVRGRPFLPGASLTTQQPLIKVAGKKIKSIFAGLGKNARGLRKSFKNLGGKAASASLFRLGKGAKFLGDTATVALAPLKGLIVGTAAAMRNIKNLPGVLNKASSAAFGFVQTNFLTTTGLKNIAKQAVLAGFSFFKMINPMNLVRLATIGLQKVFSGGAFGKILLIAVILGAIWAIAGKQILAAVQPLIDVFGTLGEQLGPVFGDLLKTLGVALVAIIAPLAGVVLVILDAIVPAIVQLVNVLVPIIKIVVQLASIFIKALVPILLIASTILTALVAGPLTLFLQLFRVLTPILEGVAFLLNFVAEGVKFISDQINKLATAVFDLLKDFPLIGGLLTVEGKTPDKPVPTEEQGKDKPTLAEGTGGGRGPILQTSSVTPFQSGGIITNGPILGLVGESGPEAVIPLNSNIGMGGPINITIPVTLDGIEIGKTTVKISEEELRRHGRAPIGRFGGSA